MNAKNRKATDVAIIRHNATGEHFLADIGEYHGALMVSQAIDLRTTLGSDWREREVRSEEWDELLGIDTNEIEESDLKNWTSSKITIVHAF